MADLNAPRPTQSKIKHTILDNYLKSWGGIILHGLRGEAARRRALGQPFSVHFTYVDCFSSWGRFLGEQEDAVAGRLRTPVFGSPIIGVQALDSLVDFAAKQGISLRTTAILVEKMPAEYQELQRSLSMAGLSARVRATDDFRSLADGQIAVVQADSLVLAPRLIQYTQQSGYRFAFFLLDPYGPTGIPLTFVKDIISAPRHDVMINMPYQDLHKKTGVVTKGNDEPPLQKLVKHYDLMFGSAGWRTIVRRIENEVDDEAWDTYMTHLDTIGANSSAYTLVRDLELELANEYKQALQRTDKTLRVKSIPLHFSDKERTMFHLYLTTHDPSGALAMNEVLWKAGYEENVLRQRLKQAKEEARQVSRWGGVQGSLFDEDIQQAPIKPPRPPIDEIAHHIVTRFSGRTITRRQLYAGLVQEPYFADEIDKAIKQLKRSGRAAFNGTSLTNETDISIMASS